MRGRFFDKKLCLLGKGPLTVNINLTRDKKTAVKAVRFRQKVALQHFLTKMVKKCRKLTKQSRLLR